MDIPTATHITHSITPPTSVIIQGVYDPVASTVVEVIVADVRRELKRHYEDIVKDSADFTSTFALAYIYSAWLKVIPPISVNMEG